jgi:hypothetical protein
MLTRDFPYYQGAKDGVDEEERRSYPSCLFRIFGYCKTLLYEVHFLRVSVVRVDEVCVMMWLHARLGAGSVLSSFTNAPPLRKSFTFQLSAKRRIRKHSAVNWDAVVIL